MGVATKAGEAQRDVVLKYLKTFHRKRGYMPTLVEVSDETGIPRSTLVWHLGTLREEGKILYDEGRLARSLRLP